MSVKAARHQLGNALQDALPSYAVFPDYSETDEIVKPTLFLDRTSLTRAGVGQGFFMNTFSLYVVIPANWDEDKLDDCLEEVVETLDEVTMTRWTNANRGKFKDVNSCYVITIEAQSVRNNN